MAMNPNGIIKGFNILKNKPVGEYSCAISSHKNIQFKKTQKSKECAFLVDGVFGVIVKLRCIDSSFGKTGETRRRKADRV